MNLATFFENLLVIELANVLAGPAVGMFFAEMGAKVVKIESTETKGDVTRTWKTEHESFDNDISAYFSSVNWGKYSLALNLKNPESLSHLYALVGKADIVIANYKPGDDVKLKVDYETLKQYKHDLIYGKINGYGSTNTRAGFDAIIQAEAGYAFMNGTLDTPPLKMPLALMDLLAAHQLKQALLLALMQRQMTGEGVCVEVSLIHAGVSALANQAANYLVANHVPQRIGSEHPNIVPYGTIYSTLDDKQITLAVGNDAQFAKLCAILNFPELAKDEKYATNFQRVKHRNELNAILSRAIANEHAQVLMDKFIAQAVPAGMVNDMQSVFMMPEAQELLMEKEGMKGLRTIAFKGIVPQRDLKQPPHFNE